MPREWRWLHETLNESRSAVTVGSTPQVERLERPGLAATSCGASALRKVRLELAELG